MRKLIVFLIAYLFLTSAFGQVREQADVAINGAYFSPTTIAGCNNAVLKMQVGNTSASDQIPAGGVTVYVEGPLNKPYTFKNVAPTPIEGSADGLSWTYHPDVNTWVGVNNSIIPPQSSLTYSFAVEGTNVTATAIPTDVWVTPNLSWVQHSDTPDNNKQSPTANVSEACITNHTITVTSDKPNPTIGETVTLTATGCPAGGTYSWAPPGGTAGGTGGNTYTVPATNNSVTYTASCSEGGSGNIPVQGVAVTPFTVDPPTQTVVTGTPVTLTASGCAGTVTWSPGGSTGNTLTVNAGFGANTYTATCSDGRTASGTVTGTTTPVQITTGPSTVPTGTSVPLTATGCAGGVITWSPGGTTGNTTSVVAADGEQVVTATCSLGGTATTTITGVASGCQANAGVLN
jgi:hypothetical protein